MDEKINLEGTIESALPPVQQSSLRQRIMAVTLSSTAARDWFQKARDGVKPWAQFVNMARFKAPKSLNPLPNRIIKNVEHFQGNYLFVFLGLVIFCILTSPMLLVAITACLGACYIIKIKNQEKKLTVMGRELSVAQQYAGVGILSFPIFWLAGAGSVIFWLIGASFFVIMLHASLYVPQEELEGFDLEMEEVQTV